MTTYLTHATIFISLDQNQPNHLSTNQDGAWSAYGGVGGGTLSSGGSSSSSTLSTYPSYIGCNVTSSPSTTYNPPVLTYTDLNSGSNANSNGLHSSLGLGQVGTNSSGKQANKLYQKTIAYLVSFQRKLNFSSSRIVTQQFAKN